MSLASGLRVTCKKLITKYGEPALYKSVTQTDNVSAGTVSEGGSNVAVYAAPIKKMRRMANDAIDAVIRSFAGGGRVLAGEEAILIAASDLSVQPKPGDLFTFGIADVAANRRRVVDVDIIRAQAIDLAYQIGVEK